MQSHIKRAIFAQYRKLGIDGNDRHAVQMRVIGKPSLKEMNDEEGQKLYEGLCYQLSERPHNFLWKRGAKRHAPAPRADLRFIHVLWGLLEEADHVKAKGRTGLNAFIRARFQASWGSVPLDVDMLRDHGKIDAVIQALKSWCDRTGITYE